MPSATLTLFRILTIACFSLAATFLFAADGEFAPSLAPEHPKVIELLENERITIFADKESHRSYAQRFAEKVYEAAYETTGEPAGKGLVVIGNAKDPHPILLIRQYLELAYGEDYSADDPEIKRVFGDVIQEFEKASVEVKKEVGVDLESIAYVAPLPMEGPILNIYLLAKEENFDATLIEKRIHESVDILTISKEFEDYHWAVYLPPKNAIDKALKEVLPAVMKKQKMGFFKRTLIRGAVATFKPLIRDAMEGVRKGVMYDTVLKATSDLGEDDRDALTEAYITSLMPRGKIFPGKKEDRSLDAIREQKRKNVEYAKDPYREPTAIQELDTENYSSILGSYRVQEKQTILIYAEDGKLMFRRQENDPKEIFLVSDFQFTTEDRKMTINFQKDESGQIAGGELRRHRWRDTFIRKEDS